MFEIIEVICTLLSQEHDSSDGEITSVSGTSLTSADRDKISVTSMDMLIDRERMNDKSHYGAAGMNH